MSQTITFSDEQVTSVLAAAKTITEAFSNVPPAGQDPQKMKQAAVAYINEKLSVDQGGFLAQADANFVSAALVLRDDNMSPGQGSAVYEGVPVGVALFDGPEGDDGSQAATRNFKGSSNIQTVSKAIIAAGGKAEVWTWKTDGKIYNAKTGQKVPDTKVRVGGVESTLQNG